MLPAFTPIPELRKSTAWWCLSCIVSRSLVGEEIIDICERANLDRAPNGLEVGHHVGSLRQWSQCFNEEGFNLTIVALQPKDSSRDLNCKIYQWPPAFDRFTKR